MTEAWHDFPAPGHIIQGDGSRFQWENCAPTTWANLIVSQEQGKRPPKGAPWYPSGASLRAQTGDTSGGITPGLLDRTVYRIYGLDLIPRIATLAAVQEALDAGMSVGILHDYSAIAAAGMSGSPGFYGSHSSPMFGTRELPSGEVQWLDADPLYDGRRAGIPKGPQWIRRSVIVKAAGDLALDSSGVTVRQKYGPGKLYAVFTTKPYEKPTVVESWPADEAARANRMIRSAWRVTTGKVQRLSPGQPLFASPGGPRVTRVSSTTPVSVGYVGSAGSGWGLVIVGTKVPYSDGVTRPTGLYVPEAAGPISNR